MQEVNYYPLAQSPRKGTEAGYCNCRKHLGRLSEKMIKKHECLRKQCNYFEKREEHPYWERREKIKEAKKKKKEEEKKKNGYN